jgi:regulator of RNase E activity RraB
MRLWPLLTIFLTLGVFAMDGDQKVIEALKSNGSDLTKVHEIDFFFDFTEFDHAASIANLISEEGFEVRMFENNDGTFTIEAKKSMAPDLQNMQELTMHFTDLTRDYGGKYDGWGTEIVE